MYGSFSGKILYNELQKEMTANEKTLIEEFKNQFQYINKKKSQQFNSIFTKPDKITTDGIFIM